MKKLQAENWLFAYLQQWRRSRRLSHAVLALAIVLPIAAALFAFSPLAWPVLLAAAMLALAMLLAVFGWLDRKMRLQAADIAEHLNRTTPEFEESGDLLLRPVASLTSLERVQQERLQARVPAVLSRAVLPRSHVRRSLWSLLAAAAASALLLAIAATGASQLMMPHDGLVLQPADSASAGTPQPLRIELVQIDILPPAYTGRPARQTDELNLRVEEGAQVRWQLRLNRAAAAVELRFSQGDSLQMRSKSGEFWYAETAHFESGLYYLAFTDSANSLWTSAYFKLAVQPDAPPEVTVTAPEPRTTLRIDSLYPVPVRLLARDDYGIADAYLIATVSKGSGEGVKFREDTLAFTGRHPDGSAVRFSRALDLRQLDMAPGDELYFYAEVFDNRQPAANVTRTSTFFVNIADTGQVLVASTEGIAVNLIPDYFRSQRQIILDTIKLLEEQAQISEREFKSRSNELAHDQKSLRLRYGQYLGEEFVTNIGPGAEESGDGHDDHDHAAHEETPATSGQLWDFNFFGGEELPEDTRQAQELLESMMHIHDDAEMATLFAQSIQSQLKAALSEMWDAELHLRLFEPKKALPYEYKALQLLKSVQQAARVYVQRVGFESPPLRPDEKRLTGKLDGIRNQATTMRAPADDSVAVLRRSLHILQKLRHGGTVASADAELLEDAARYLAARAASQPDRLLEPLQALRRLIDQVQSGSPRSSELIAAAEGGLWQLLPAAKPEPQRSGPPGSAVARRYFDALGAQQ